MRSLPTRPRVALSLTLGFAILALPAIARAQWSATGGGDHGGADWTPANGSAIAGVHTNVGTFTIPSGTTVYVQPWNGSSFGAIEVNARTINVAGTLNGDARGSLGGSGGAAGVNEGCSCNPVSGGRAGGGGQGAGGCGATAAAGTTGGEGGGGGGGGGSLGYGGGGGAGGTGRRHWNCGIATFTGGGAGAACSDSASEAVVMGPGGGGGAGGGGYVNCSGYGTVSAGAGGTGGAGGARIALLAPAGSLTVTGLVTSNGGTGGAGGRGASGNMYSGSGGGGGGAGAAGGGILLKGFDVAVSGTVRALGGAGGAGGSAGTGAGSCSYPSEGGDGGGGGSGGRIKVFAVNRTDAAATYLATGGSGGPAGAGAQCGTNGIAGLTGQTGSLTRSACSSCNSPPTVASPTPANGTYVAGPSVTFRANVAAPESGQTVAADFNVTGSWSAGSSVTTSGTSSYTTTLANGSYSWSVRARDAAGATSGTLGPYSLVVDSALPVVTGVSPNGGQILKGGDTVAITWTATDANFGATPIRLRLSTDGGGTWPTTIAAAIANTGTYSWTVPALNTASARIEVLATDLAGNTGVSISAANFTIDSAAPGAPGTPAATPNPSAGAVTVSWSPSADTGGSGIASYTLEVAANGGGFTALTTLAGASHTYTPAQGSYIYRVIARDRAGNASVYSASSVALVVDTTAPSLPGVPSGTPNPTNGTLALTWTAATDSGGSGLAAYDLEVGTNGGPFGPFTSVATAGYTYSPPEGSHYYRVRARDRAGNTSAYAMMLSGIIVDRTAPTAPGTPSVTPNPANGSVAISWNAATDVDGSGVDAYVLEVAANGGLFAPLVTQATVGYTYSPGEGTYLYRVRARDRATNLSGWSAPSATVVVDRTTPTTPGTPSASPNPTNGAVTIAWASSADAGGSGLAGYLLEVSSDGGAFAALATVSGTSHVYQPSEGRYAYRLRARDGAGNVSAYSAVSSTVVVDTTAPGVPGTPSASPNPSNGAVTISWSAPADTGGSGLAGYLVDVSVNGGAYFALATVTSPSHSYTPAQGSHVYRVRARDAAGNQSNWSATSAALVLDTTAPAAPGTPSGTPNPSSGSVTIAWAAATDTGGAGLADYTLEVAANGGAFTALATLTATTHVYAPPQGSYVYRVRARDRAGNTSANSAGSSAVVVDTTAPSAPGTPSATPNPSPGTPLTITWAASTDTGGAGLAGYTLQRSPNLSSWATIASPSSATYTDATASGSYYYRVLARDSAGNASAYSAPSAKALVTKPPVANSASVSVDEDAALPITLAATDPENDALTYTVVAQPSSGTLGGTPPAVTYTPRANFNGTDTFTFRANDGSWNSNTATITITVRPVNDAPVATAQALSVDEDKPLAITLAGTDVENDALSYTIVDQPTNGTLTGTPPSLTYTPKKDFHGSDRVNFRVRDGKVDSAPAAVTITVRPVNDAPVATPQTLTVDEGSTRAIVLAATDVDGDALTYRVSTPPAHGALSGTPPSLVYTPANGYNGPDELQFVARDGTVDSAPVKLAITIRNLPPAVTPYADDLTPDEGQPVLYAVDALDPGGDVVTYRWAFGDGATSTDQNPLHAFADEGTYEVTLVVDDGDGGVVTKKLTLVVSNVAPVLTAALDTTPALEGAQLGFTASAVDPGADTLAYSWDFGDAATSAERNPTHAYANQGTYTVTVRVTDGDGASDTETFTVEVGNVAPDASITLGDDAPTEGRELSLRANATDPGADVLTYAWDFGDGETSTEAEPLHTWTDDGEYTVRVTVSDGDGGSTERTLAVAVVNAPPVVDTLEALEAGDEGATMAFAATASDPAGANDTLTYSWAWGDNTEPTEGASATHAFADDGSYTVTLTVREEDGGEVTRSVTLAIANVAPTPAAPGPQKIEAGELLEVLLSATDPGGARDPLAWSLVNGPGDLASGGAYQWRPEPTLDEKVSVTARVTDDEGATADVTFEVTVEPRDDDDDGVLDRADNCPLVANAEQSDIDSDGQGDPCDGDEDGDGVSNEADNCVSTANVNQEDLDEDGAGDVCDDDADGDGLENTVEVALGTKPLARDSDGDTIDDETEVKDANDPADTDADGLIDALDLESDADGVPDADEAGDLDLDTPPADTDADGTPDHLDADSDGDTVEDVRDLCRIVADPKQENADRDGQGDACDGDLDGDGAVNDEDNCPGIANAEQVDLDADGSGDACDGDLDGDSRPNDSDNCVNLANQNQQDEDEDGIGDACDPEQGCACGGDAGLGAFALFGLAALLRRRRRA